MARTALLKMGDFEAPNGHCFLMGMGQNPGTPGEPQNSWDLWMFIPLKMYLIGIDS
jgi:hypothetical protein